MYWQSLVQGYLFAIVFFTFLSLLKYTLLSDLALKVKAHLYFKERLLYF